MTRTRRLIIACLLVVPILIAAYIRAQPLVFNESLWEHRHCIKMAGMALVGYANENEGKFPIHPDGYGDALLLLDDGYFSLTGPGYDFQAAYEAARKSNDMPEDKCGRVYVQGLTEESPPEIALLFDKLPTPGGDHCHFPRRLWAPVGREVWLVSSMTTFVEERDWPAFAEKQIALLIDIGFDDEQAKRVYTIGQE